MSKTKPPIINCHTHIFTGRYVPPWLAKSLVSWPFYYLLPISGLVGVMRWWYIHPNGPNQFRFKSWVRKILSVFYYLTIWLKRNLIPNVILNVLGIYITIQFFFIAYDWISKLTSKDGVGPSGFINDIRDRLIEMGILHVQNNVGIIILYIIFLILFYKPGRNLIIFLLKNIFSFLGSIPGKQTMELLHRYILIGRYSTYKSQSGIFSKLRGQYPQGSGFIVLPMDMEFMESGSLNKENQIRQQMQDLVEISAIHEKHFFPFVFVDPRRRLNDKEYYDYQKSPAGSVEVVDQCLVRQWIEVHKFKGIKIYPALGYYPFDEDLLLLWKYAAEHQIPVMTHCVKGTIFYRGTKKKEWDVHPVFMEYASKKEQSNDKDFEDIPGERRKEFRSMLLAERSNVDFTVNFTHPLNYLCLLEERLLRKVVENATNDDIRIAFGFNGPDKPLSHDLRQLKICLAHFGGDEHWRKAMESDRDNISSQLIRNPERGIKFFSDDDMNEDPLKTGRFQWLWKNADWYTLICSIILQYPNVYADISYILHQRDIFPLLKQTLQYPSIRERILYGTDFYVVRNHLSDKEMLTNIVGGLSDDDFDQIARYNPQNYLANSIHWSTKN